MKQNNFYKYMDIRINGGSGGGGGKARTGRFAPSNKPPKTLGQRLLTGAKGVISRLKTIYGKK